MPVPKVPGKRQNIQPVDSDLTGTALTAALNDRIRRINQAFVPDEAAPAPAGGANFVYEVPAGSLNGTNKVFTLSKTPDPPASLTLNLNGVIQAEDGLGIAWTDFTLAGSTITYKVAPDPNSWHFAMYES